MEEELIVVTAPNEAGRKFIKLLIYLKRPFAVLTNNLKEERALKKLGVSQIIRIHTNHTDEWAVPEQKVGRIFIFENSLNLTCRYLQICRPWTSRPIYVITRTGNSPGIYRGLGANHIIHSLNGEVGFLLK
ncbi:MULTISPECIES: hypothetical protein [Paenibacillus]|uniref:Uncharacterized protein n=1 Tax=Paenibacillus azoreducens TaxID=116718 RepID=A0A919YAX6_9BACL|nr:MULTISPECIES: hypothetical protein [Paenibacillus]MBE9917196.1 hypothetical protein [Paenibacillus donghaensis]GIO48231.1 hypothetical protein J34TS1_29960 [Paenibacillus azoreducens]